MYEYDNNNFIRYLQKKNFFIASASNCNYNYTIYSLASSLNFEYLKNVNLGHSIKRIQENATAAFLKNFGYKYILVANGWPVTSESKNADLVMRVDFGWRNEFTIALIKTTVLRVLFPETSVTRTKGIRNTFSILPMIKDMIEGPRFVLAHILCPHAPYVFGRKGEASNLRGEAAKDYRNRGAYLNQLIFVNAKVKEIVDRLLWDAAKSPVIIIQSDHGNNSILSTEKDGWNNPNPSRDALRERAGILNAYYLPEKGRKLLYKSITPVNTFRVVLNCCFNTSYKLLEDKIYYVTAQGPYNFKDVSNIVKPADKE
jgi:hypothetical protein